MLVFVFLLYVCAIAGWWWLSRWSVSWWGGSVRTGSELGFVGNVVLVEVLHLLLGLLVVDGVGSGCRRVSALILLHDAFTPPTVWLARSSKTYHLVLKACWRYV